MDTRQKIINATANLIVEEGLDAARISKIAKRAGLTDGAIYRHFDNKETLLVEVFLDITTEIEEHAKRFSQQEDTSQEETAKERFINFLEDLFGFFLEQPERFVLFESLKHATSVNKENKVSALEQTFNLLTNLLNETKSENLIRQNTRNEIIIPAIYGALSQFVRESFQKNQRVEKSDLKEVIDIFWQGLQ